MLTREQYNWEARREWKDFKDKEGEENDQMIKAASVHLYTMLLLGLQVLELNIYHFPWTAVFLNL